MSGATGDTTVADRPLVAVNADESCLGNGREGENPGGAGMLVEFLRPGGIVRRDLWVSERATTNNRMALRSVIECFAALGRKGRALRVVFITDSRYIVDGMKVWVPAWKKRGWRRRTGDVKNLERWQAAERAVGDQWVDWRWVRGHAGHPQNEYANDLAMRAAATQDNSDGLIESGFDAWLERHAQAGAPLMPEPFPLAAAFQASPQLPHV